MRTTRRPSQGTGPALATVATLLCCGLASAQLRVATWNVTNYSSGRVTEFQTAIYGEFEGRSLGPDILIGQEFTSQTSVNNYLAILNGAPGSPGDWAAAPFINGNDTDNAFFYRTSKLDFLNVTVVSVGSGAPNHPRDVERYDVRLVGYSGDAAVLACYSSHMKAGDTSDDQARRLVEATAIRADAETLNPAWNFLLAGDFNIQSSGQAAYVELVGSQVNNDGRFHDPIATPGSWNNNASFRFVHTQDPIGSGGMDDRHDQILVDFDLIDGAGLDYIGDPNTPYSTTTWDDVNHSYRSWGNDGTSFNANLRVTGNTMVGPTIAQALINAATTAGHLPVYLDLRVPAEVDSETTLDFGSVVQNDPAVLTLHVENSGDVGLWGVDGISDLHYSLDTSAGFSVTPGPTVYVDAAGGGGNSHLVSMDTSVVGPTSGTLTILSDSVDEPARVVTLVGEVVESGGGCLGDLTGDDAIDLDDLSILLVNFGISNGATYAQGDLTGDGAVDLDDLSELLVRFGSSCP